jgi:ribose 5-phosphate isomerase B
MTIYLGADHRGFSLKEQIKVWLQQQGQQVVDCGNTQLDPEDDYPQYAFAVAEQVADNIQGRGIVFCGSGVGVDIAANKVPGVRSAVGLSPTMVQAARRDDDINVLAIAADITDEKTTQQLVTSFLATPFRQEERYARRLTEISEREEQQKG